jgi:hypothetical protein
MISRNQSWYRFGLPRRSAVEEARVNPLRSGFRDAVDGVGFLTSESSPHLDRP